MSSPAHRVEVDPHGVWVDVLCACVDRGEARHGVLDVGRAGPGVYGEAPAAPPAMREKQP